MTQETTRAILNFFAFSSKIMHVALALSAFRFAIHSLSDAASVRVCACFNSSLATSIACSNLLNLAITIGVVVAPRVQQMPVIILHNKIQHINSNTTNWLFNAQHKSSANTWIRYLSVTNRDNYKTFYQKYEVSGTS